MAHPDLPPQLPNDWDSLYTLINPRLEDVAECAALIKEAALPLRRYLKNRGDSLDVEQRTHLLGVARTIEKLVTAGAALPDTFFGEGSPSLAIQLCEDAEQQTENALPLLEIDADLRREEVLECLRELNEMTCSLSETLEQLSVLQEELRDVDDLPSGNLLEEEEPFADEWGVFWTEGADAWNAIEVPGTGKSQPGKMTPREILHFSEECCCFSAMDEGVAIILLERLLNEGHASPIVHYALGRANLARAEMLCDNPRRPGESEQYFLRADEWFALASSEWKSGAVFAGRAVALLGLNRWVEALLEAKQATIIEPDRAAFWEILAQAFGVTGDLKEKSEALREAIRLDPVKSAYRESLISTLLEIDDLPAALAAGREAIALPTAHRDVHRTSRIYSDLGVVFSRLGRHEEAMRAMREGLRRAVMLIRGRDGVRFQTASSWGLLAMEAFILGRHAEAVSCWERAVLLDGAYFDAKPEEISLWESSITCAGHQRAAEIPVYDWNSVIPTGLPAL